MVHGKPSEQPAYRDSYKEADTRMWQHTAKFSNAVLYSPDTDVTIIGLGAIGETTNAIVQIDTLGSQQQSYIDISSLRDKIRQDPALSAVAPDQRCHAVQDVFVASGSDSASFFSGLGKAAFVDVLLEAC